MPVGYSVTRGDQHSPGRRRAFTCRKRKSLGKKELSNQCNRPVPRARQFASRDLPEVSACSFPEFHSAFCRTAPGKGQEVQGATDILGRRNNKHVSLCSWQALAHSSDRVELSPPPANRPVSPAPSSPLGTSCSSAARVQRPSADARDKEEGVGSSCFPPETALGFLTLALLRPDEIHNCSHQQSQHGADHPHHDIDEDQTA